MPRKLFKIKSADDAEGYLVIDPAYHEYYNLDEIINAFRYPEDKLNGTHNG